MRDWRNGKTAMNKKIRERKTSGKAAGIENTGTENCGKECGIRIRKKILDFIFRLLSE